MTALPGERMRYCGKCVSGEHTLGVDTWQTKHCKLQREGCECSCDCPYFRVLIEDPHCDRRRTPSRWHPRRRSPRGWAQRHIHENIRPPILSPDEYLNPTPSDRTPT
jgi:hypothetical protein